MKRVISCTYVRIIYCQKIPCGIQTVLYVPRIMFSTGMFMRFMLRSSNDKLNKNHDWKRAHWQDVPIKALKHEIWEPLNWFRFSRAYVSAAYGRENWEMMETEEFEFQRAMDTGIRAMYCLTSDDFDVRILPHTYLCGSVTDSNVIVCKPLCRVVWGI